MMISRTNRVRRRGAVAVLVAICLIPLIGVLALSLEGGMMLAARRRAQTVADASAYAAACQLYKQSSLDPTGLDVLGKAHAAASANAKANDFNNDGKTNKVEVNLPPSSQSPSWQINPGFVEVIITSYQPRSFSAIFGSGTMTIAARAVARISLSSPPSVILLEPKKSQGFTLSGGTTLTTESVVQVNSSSSTGTTLTGGSTLSVSKLQLHGGGTRDISSRVIGAVQTGVNSFSDPLASLPTPTTAGLSNQSFTSTYGTSTISPGVYNNGISISGGMTVTMRPGIYYIKKNGLTLSGGVTLRGTGVTIYLDNSGNNNDFSVSGGANVNLIPPTSGTYAGLTYFQDRNNSNALSFSGGASISMVGTLYAAAADINISGGISNTYGSQLIANSMSISGGARIKVNTVTDSKLGYVAAGASSAAGVSLVE